MASKLVKDAVKNAFSKETSQRESYLLNEALQRDERKAYIAADRAYNSNNAGEYTDEVLSICSDTLELLLESRSIRQLHYRRIGGIAFTISTRTFLIFLCENFERIMNSAYDAIKNSQEQVSLAQINSFLKAMKKEDEKQKNGEVSLLIGPLVDEMQRLFEVEFKKVGFLKYHLGLGKQN